MKQTQSYVTRVQFAVPDTVLPPMQDSLKKQPAFQILKPGIATGHTILQDIDAAHPDILILDLNLPGLDVDDLLTTLNARKMRPHVLVIGARHQLQADLQNYRAVRGVLLRSLALSPVFRHVLDGLVEGYRYFMSLPASEPSLYQLNRAETVLLALMALGLDAGELVEELGCTLNAIYLRQVGLRRKLNVDSNLKATTKAIKTGLAGALTGVDERAKSKGAA